MNWSSSAQSEQRGRAAYLVASAYVEHEGPSDERAALFAALIGFIDDQSVKVRAALAYGMLKSARAPRVAIVALAKDNPIISRAVIQFSPVLIDADLLSLIGDAPKDLLLAMAARPKLSAKLCNALVLTKDKDVTLTLLRRDDIVFSASQLDAITGLFSQDAAVRGCVLKKDNLSARSRLCLVKEAAQAIRGGRLVSGAITQKRQARLFRDCLDDAVCEIGEVAVSASDFSLLMDLREDGAFNTRLLIHALLNGHALFFANAVAQLCDLPHAKTFTVLGSGARPALHAMLSRSGMSASLQNLLARLVIYAREVDLEEDVSGRLFVVTALIEELVIEHEGEIPDDLMTAFSYLNEQNLKLARVAARGVMPGFVKQTEQISAFPITDDARELMAEEQLALPAA